MMPQQAPSSLHFKGFGIAASQPPAPPPETELLYTWRDARNLPGLLRHLPTRVKCTPPTRAPSPSGVDKPHECTCARKPQNIKREGTCNRLILDIKPQKPFLLLLPNTGGQEFFFSRTQGKNGTYGNTKNNSSSRSAHAMRMTAILTASPLCAHENKIGISKSNYVGLLRVNPLPLALPFGGQMADSPVHPLQLYVMDLPS